MKQFFLFIAFSAVTFLSPAQGIKSIVTVESLSESFTPTTADKQTFVELKNAIQEFMNNTKWTNETFAEEERIECNIFINISERISIDQFKGTIQVQSSRPIFNSSYRTPLFSFKDNDFAFQYVRNSTIQYTKGRFDTNLASVMAFYAYVIIGMDYDSFSEFGGEQYLTLAQNIVLDASEKGFEGWSAKGRSTKNRFYLIEDLLHQSFKPFRKAFYVYHLKGFDQLYTKQEEGRTQVFNAMKLLDEVNKSRPGNNWIPLFMIAKRDELISLFSKSNASQKREIVPLLKSYDPANASLYEQILKNN